MTAAKHTPDLVPDWVGEFHTFDNWVNTCTGEVETKAICVDTKGRRCKSGADFMRARDENCFPVRYFWDCKPDETARQRDLLLKACVLLNRMIEVAHPQFNWKESALDAEAIGLLNDADIALKKALAACETK